MAEDPKQDAKTPPAGKGEKRGWGRIVAIALGIAAVLAVPTAIVKFYGLFDSWWPAEVQVRLTTCEQYRIVLETTNSGGQAATVAQPVFTIRSPRGTSELRMLSYVEVLPDETVRVEPEASLLQTYRAQNPFFNREESAAGACKIGVSAPVTPASGTHPNATGECTCVFR